MVWSVSLRWLACLACLREMSSSSFCLVISICWMSFWWVSLSLCWRKRISYSWSQLWQQLFSLIFQLLQYQSSQISDQLKACKECFRLCIYQYHLDQLSSKLAYSQVNTVDLLIFYFVSQYLTYGYTQLIAITPNIHPHPFIYYSPIAIIITMPKAYKQISIQGISVELDDQFPQQEHSRVKFRVLQDGDINRKHTTQLDADIKINKLQWPQPLELIYTEQSRLDFQVISLPQADDTQQPQILYRGIYYLSSDSFFRRTSTHIYNLEGEKKGLMKWEIKIVNKELQQIHQKIAQKQRPLVRQDLIGLIKLHQAFLEVNSPVFNTKKYQNSLSLKIKFEDQQYIFEQGAGLHWKLVDLKIQYVINGSRTIQFQLFQQGKLILDGKTDCEKIKEFRRFINHSVPICNKNAIKIGVLILEYRYIAKQELLDLLYSPNNKLNYSPERCLSSGTLKASSQATFTKHIHPKLKDSQSVFNPAGSKVGQSRYKIAYLMNHNSDIKIPRATRFSSSLAMNPNISYVDPEKSSDFFVKKGKGPYITKGSKFDFTRQYKGNPGVGSYKLPSIWSKY